VIGSDPRQLHAFPPVLPASQRGPPPPGGARTPSKSLARANRAEHPSTILGSSTASRSLPSSTQSNDVTSRLTDSPALAPQAVRQAMRGFIHATVHSEVPVRQAIGARPVPEGGRFVVEIGESTVVYSVQRTPTRTRMSVRTPATVCQGRLVRGSASCSTSPAHGRRRFDEDDLHSSAHARRRYSVTPAPRRTRAAACSRCAVSRSRRKAARSMSPSSMAPLDPARWPVSSSVWPQGLRVPVEPGTLGSTRLRRPAQRAIPALRGGQRQAAEDIARSTPRSAPPTRWCGLALSRPAS